MKCADCRWHFPLEAVLDGRDVCNCLQEPYPINAMTYTTKAHECHIPDKFSPKDARISYYVVTPSTAGTS